MSKFFVLAIAALILEATLTAHVPQSAMAAAQPPLGPTPNQPPPAQTEPPCGQVLGTARGGFYVGLRRLDDTTVSIQAFRAKAPSSDVFADGWFYVDQCYSVAQADKKALEWARFYASTGSRVVVGSVENGPMNLPAQAGTPPPTPIRPSSRLPHG